MPDQELKDREIARMALGIEEKGLMFYTRVAAKFADPEIRNIFLRLAEEEKEHMRTFERIFELSSGERGFDRERSNYIRKLLESSVFPPKEKMEDLVARIGSPKEALSVGIEAEKDAILFYHELYQHTSAQEAREALSKLLEEEKMHLVELRETMEDLP